MRRMLTTGLVTAAVLTSATGSHDPDHDLAIGSCIVTFVGEGFHHGVQKGLVGVVQSVDCPLDVPPIRQIVRIDEPCPPRTDQLIVTNRRDTKVCTPLNPLRPPETGQDPSAPR